MFNRLRSTEPISSGIHFFRARGLLLPTNDEHVLERQVIEQGFIIGISVHNFLYPIYDRHQQAVVVRLSDMMNIPISAFDTLELPFYKEIHPSQLGEGSSRGSN